MATLLQLRHGSPVPSWASNASLGGKAYNQALAAADGLPVLDGLVLPTDIFPGQRWIEQVGTQPRPEQDRAVRNHLSARGIDLLAAVRELGAERVAVRSSADVEDLPVASFAGSFTTVLNAAPEQTPVAVLDVWASTYQERVGAYLSDRGLGHRLLSLRMAVLIQPMVMPVLAGVALSHPPGRPDDSRIPVNIVRGLGEALVSGAVTPQSFLLERGTWVVVKVQDGLDIDLVCEMAPSIGRTVEFLEVRRGLPQDIEFAVTTGFQFMLLQNRPIAQRLSFGEVK